MYINVPMPLPERKLEAEKKGDTLRIIERLDRLESVVNQHIQGKNLRLCVWLSSTCEVHYTVKVSADSGRWLWMDQVCVDQVLQPCVCLWTETRSKGQLI